MKRRIPDEIPALESVSSGMTNQQNPRIFKKHQHEHELTLPKIRKKQKRTHVVPVSVKKVQQQTNPSVKPASAPVKKARLAQPNDDTLNLDAIPVLDKINQTGAESGKPINWTELRRKNSKMK